MASREDGFISPIDFEALQGKLQEAFSGELDPFATLLRASFFANNILRIHKKLCAVDVTGWFIWPFKWVNTGVIKPF